MMAAVAGLSARRLALVRGRLEAFADSVFEGAVQRSEQRKWGGCYLRGLMLEGRRKSIEPMAARLEDGDEQCLQQFVNQSPWDEQVVRANLARRMSAELAPEAWIVDDTGFSEEGAFLGRRGAPVLGDAGAYRQLPDRGVDLGRDRCSVVSAELAHLSARRMGQGRCASAQGARARRGSPPAEVAAGVGDDR
jgi:hypothetical protein